MKKPFFFTIWALMLGLAGLPLGTAFSATVLRVGDVAGSAGATISIPVQFESNASVAAIQMDFIYDPALLSMGVAQSGSSVADHVVTTNPIASGKLRLVVHSLTNSALGSNVLVTLPVTVASDAVLTSDPVLMLANLVLSDGNGNQVTPMVAPSVRLLGIKDNQRFNGRTGVTLTANPDASSDGTVSRVEFSVDGVKVGSVTSSPYSFLWMPPGSGTFNITATVFGSNGLASSTRTTPVIVVGVGTQPIAAVYNGLIQPETFSMARSGFFNVTTTAKGSFTGKVTVAGVSYALTGKFDANGEASPSIVRKGKTPLTLGLQLDAVNLKDQIRGSISDGAFTADIVADRVVWNAKTRKAPQAGAYTVLLPANPAKTGTLYPQGDGYAAVTVSTLGAVKFTGVLADGTPFSQATTVSKDGAIPFYVSLYKNAGVLMGDLAFESVPGVSDLGGVVDWYKPALPKSLTYKDSFTTEINLIGSKYVAPATGKRVLELANKADNLRITVGGGNLAVPLEKVISWDAKNKATILADTKKFKLTLVSASGLLNGSFVHPVTNKVVLFSGVVFQKQNFGGGYFLGPTESGTLTIEPNP